MWKWLSKPLSFIMYPYLENGISIVSCIFLLVVIILQILSRLLVPLQCVWTEEVARYLFITVVFMGSTAALTSGEHISIDVLSCKSRRLSLILLGIKSTAQVMFAGVLVWFGVKQTISHYHLGTVGSSIALPRYFVTAVIPVAFILFGVRTIQIFLSSLRAMRVDSDCRATKTVG